jgi:hypothetical protein
MGRLEIGLSVVDWIGLAQDRYSSRVVVNDIMNVRVPQNAGNFISSFTTNSFSRRAQPYEVS